MWIFSTTSLGYARTNMGFHQKHLTFLKVLQWISSDMRWEFVLTTKGIFHEYV